MSTTCFPSANLSLKNSFQTIQSTLKYNGLKLTLADHGPAHFVMFFLALLPWKPSALCLYHLHLIGVTSTVRSHFGDFPRPFPQGYSACH